MLLFMVCELLRVSVHIYTCAVLAGGVFGIPLDGLSHVGISLVGIAWNVLGHYLDLPGSYPWFMAQFHFMSSESEGSVL